MERIYCYAENGQETQGRLFIVASAVLSGDHSELRKICEQFEIISGKGKVKWGHARHTRRMAYIHAVFAQKEFKGRLRYRVFHNVDDLDMAMVNALAAAIMVQSSAGDYAAQIYVDALSKTKRREYLRALRSAGIHVHDVRGNCQRRK